MGQYVCAVSSWTVTSQGDLVKTTEHQSSAQTVQWVTKRKEALFTFPPVVAAHHHTVISSVWCILH